MTQSEKRIAIREGVKAIATTADWDNGRAYELNWLLGAIARLAATGTAEQEGTK